MIKTERFCYRAGSKMILDNVSITVPDGAITVLIGNNGSGKTTLVRSLAAYHEHSRFISGEASVDGIPLCSTSPRELSSHVALLPQTLPAPEMTVLELVSLGRAASRSPFARESACDRDKIAEILAVLGLSELQNAPLPRLSGGERQSAYFAMLLAKDSANLILDEPTSALDSHNRTRIFSHLREMRRQGRAILTVLHDLTAASQLADKILVMDEGRIVFDGAPAELAESGIPEALFGLTATVAEYGGIRHRVYVSAEEK